MEYLLLFCGFILLIFGAEVFIRGAVGIAHKLSLSPLVIGLTVLAFGTSAPELVVSLRAALNGAAGISIGNVVGSNISNVLLVLAITAILNPVTCKRKSFLRDYSFLSIVSLLFALICLQGAFTRIYGIIMMLILAGFITYNYFEGKKKHIEANEEVEEMAVLAKKSWYLIIVLTVVGLAGILWGADLLVKGAIILATNFGVSEEIIGLTIIAVGTSLPELATSAVAAIRKQNDMALGNIIGSNIWNLLLIIGASAAIVPINVPLQIAQLDVWIMLGSSMLLLPLMIKNNRLERSGGIFMLILYVSYIYSIYIRTIA